MTYAEALAHARTIWGDPAVVWISYDGTYYVGRIKTATERDLESRTSSATVCLLRTFGEGPTWPDAFNSVEIE